MRILGFFTAAALAAFFMVDPAFAQDVVATAPGGVVISPGGIFRTVIEPLVTSTISVVLTALLAWGASLLQKATNIKLEDAWRQSIHSAAMTGVTAAMSKLGVKADAMSITIKNQIVGEAVGWMLKSVPDAVKGLGLNDAPEKLRQIVESKLGLLAQTPGTVEAAKAVPNA